MDPLWLMIGIPLTTLLILAGVKQFQKYKKVSEETSNEEQTLNKKDKS